MRTVTGNVSRGGRLRKGGGGGGGGGKGGVWYRLKGETGVGRYRRGGDSMGRKCQGSN